MKGRFFVTACGVFTIAVLAPLVAAGQQNPKYKAPRTADGKPDISGTFTFSTITPLQRPDRARRQGDADMPRKPPRSKPRRTSA